jgi:DNA-directed RNA polymerase subunit RPC12/RpoP
MSVCKYCGKEFEYKVGKRLTACARCCDKVTLLPRFIKARDDLRELCGLERMGKSR